MNSKKWTEKHWINTRSGTQFLLNDPRPDLILFNDIAHALSHLCRYTGHVQCFYSVAEHSCRVFDGVRALGHNDKNTLRWALLHDASEAYLGDMSAPLKRLPELEGYRKLETRCMQAVAEKFDLKFDRDGAQPAVVKEVDLMMLTIEVEVLMSVVHPEWKLPDVDRRVRDANAPELGWDALKARTAFRSRWEMVCPPSMFSPPAA